MAKILSDFASSKQKSKERKGCSSKNRYFCKQAQQLWCNRSCDPLVFKSFNNVLDMLPINAGLFKDKHFAAPVA